AILRAYSQQLTSRDKACAAKPEPHHSLPPLETKKSALHPPPSSTLHSQPPSPPGGRSGHHRRCRWRSRGQQNSSVSPKKAGPGAAGDVRPARKRHVDEVPGIAPLLETNGGTRDSVH